LEVAIAKTEKMNRNVLLFKCGFEKVPMIWRTLSQVKSVGGLGSRRFTQSSQETKSSIYRVPNNLGDRAEFSKHVRDLSHVPLFVLSVVAATAFIVQNSSDRQLRSEMHTANQELRSEMHTANKELHTDNQKLRSEMHTANKALRSEIRSEMKELRSEVRFEMQELRTDLSKIADIIQGMERDSAKRELRFEQRLNDLFRAKNGTQVVLDHANCAQVSETTV
jgi:ribosomal protein S20